jgi:predicted small lipoprotein YifL
MRGAARRLARALIVLATSTLVVCGVKGPPHPPASDSPDAGALDAGPIDAGSSDGGPR